MGTCKRGKNRGTKICYVSLVENLRKIAILISPYMKDTSDKIFTQLNISDSLKTWDSLKDNTLITNLKVTDKPEVLFARLDVADEIEYIKSIMK